MKKIIILLMLIGGSGLAAIMNISLDEPYEGLRSNSIIEIAYDSTGVWIGSAGGASYRADGDTAWRTFTMESGLHSTEVSALAASRYQDTSIVCIATLHNENVAGQNVPKGDGFSITKDGGATWLPDSLTRPFHADYYGMLAYDLDIYQNDIYGACFYGGLLRSMNGGYSWENLYLNASDSTDLVDSTYFSYSNRYFAVKVDLTLAPDTISVWGGSAAGLNRFVFTNYRDDFKQDSAWAIAHRAADIDNSLPGNHVVALAAHGRPGRIYDAFVVGDYAYVAHDFDGLRVVDVSDSLHPVEVGYIDTPGRAWAVYVDSSSSYAYVADYARGLYIADISDPANPAYAASSLTNGRAVNVVVSGGRAYVADELFGLHIFNANPDSLDNPVIYDIYRNINDVDVVGDYAYLAAGTDGLVIVNVANLDSVEFVGQYDGDTLDVNCKEVVVDSGLAYIADADLGMLVVDVSDPANPTLKDYFNTPGVARSVYYENGYIFMTDGLELRAFEMTAPAQGDSLVYVGGYATPGTALNVMVSGNLAYVADNYSGMQIIDVSSPESMLSEGNFAPVSSAYIWAACRPGVGEDGQRYAVAYSTNYGQTWTTVIEEPAWDFAFIGDTVIVATDDGLYISDDYANWHVISEMQEMNQDGQVVLRYFPSGFYALEAVGSGLWAGGADGTVFTDHLTLDGNEIWQIFRSDINPESHYAYPSPFSPIASTRRGTTIHYLPPQTTDVTIKIYDFNLDLVATVVDGATRQGGVESDNDVWNGRNDKGETVANGVYFYNIKLGTGEDWWGKVAVVK